MNVNISKNADLFFRALDDIWCAEQVYKGSPNNGAWHCNQCIEKFLKAVLKCYEIEYEYEHGYESLIEGLEDIAPLKEQTLKNLLFINRYGNALRYKNLKTDPDQEEIKISINKAKMIIGDLSQLEKVKKYYKEADEVHKKLLQKIEREL